MNTIYQLRDNDTDENLGLYIFDNKNVTSLDIENQYNLWRKSDDDVNSFEDWLNIKNYKHSRLFVEEIYV